jgi:hypothetical protein
MIRTGRVGEVCVQLKRHIEVEASGPQRVLSEEAHQIAGSDLAIAAAANIAVAPSTGDIKDQHLDRAFVQADLARNLWGHA